MLDPDAAPADLRYAESLDAVQMRLYDTSVGDLAAWLRSRMLAWTALIGATVLSGWVLHATAAVGALGWVLGVGTLPTAMLPMFLLVGMVARANGEPWPIVDSVRKALEPQQVAWALTLITILALYTLVEGAHVGKVLTGALGGGTAWWIAYESLRAFSRMPTSTRITVQGRELYVERLLLGEPFSERSFPLGDVRPEVVQTQLGPALELGQHAFIPSRGSSAPARWWASRRLTELSKRARNLEGEAAPPAEIAALVPQMDTDAPRAVELPGVWLRSSIVGVSVGVGIAAAAYPVCAQYYWSIHAVGGIAITGIGLGLYPAFRHFTMSRSTDA